MTISVFVSVRYLVTGTSRLSVRNLVVGIVFSTSSYTVRVRVSVPLLSFGFITVT